MENSIQIMLNHTVEHTGAQQLINPSVESVSRFQRPCPRDSDRTIKTGVSSRSSSSDTQLLVDANFILPKSVATKSFQPAAGRYPQIIEAARRSSCSRVEPERCPMGSSYPRRCKGEEKTRKWYSG